MAKKQINIANKPLNKPNIDTKSKNKLLSFFKITHNDNKQTPFPAEVKSSNKGETLYPINMPETLSNVWQALANNYNIGIYRANQYRLERYKICKQAVTSEPLLNTAVQIYISEAYNPVNGKKTIEIVSKNKKVEDEFYKWFNQVGFTDSKIRDIFYNLVVYGDAFWINEITDDGIIGISVLDPFLVKNRIEFNIGMVEEIRSWNKTCLNLCNTYSSLKQIYDIIKGKEVEDISQMYKSYLFGFELAFSAVDGADTKSVAPWSITHCRNFTTENDFFPFGKPILLNAIPAYNSYRTTQMLIDMLRCQTFPRERVNIKGDEGMDLFTRFQRVDEVRQFMEKITPTSTNDDLSSVGTRIYTFEDLFEVDMIEATVDMDHLGDLEYKRTDLIQSTGIPDAYLNPSEGAGDLGGENAEALKYLNKIFQRRLEMLRESFLEGLTECFRIHLMLSGIGDGDKEIFELAMPNSVEDMNSDEISRISDAFTLAKDIIDTIGACAGLDRGETIDDKIVKDVMRRFLPVEANVIDKWIKAIYKDAEEQAEEQELLDGEEKQEEPVIGKGNLLPPTPKHESKQRVVEQIINSNKINEIYFDCKAKQGLASGNFGNKTYFNNSYLTPDKTSTISLLKEQVNLNKRKKIEEQIRR